MQSGGAHGMRTMDSRHPGTARQGRRSRGRVAYEKAINKAKFEQFKDRGLSRRVSRPHGPSAAERIRGIIAGAFTAGLPHMSAHPASHPARHERPAVCQRCAPHRPHRRVHPDRHLGAVPAPARPRLHLRLRQRCPRHADHAQGARTGITPEELIARIGAEQQRDFDGFRRLLRQLPHDALGREPRAHARDLPAPQGRRPHPPRDDPAGLRRAGGDVPAGPLRHAAPVRSAARSTSTATAARSAARPTRRPTC